MAAFGNIKIKDGKKKKTQQGHGKFSKYGRPGPNGSNKKYRKPYRGQGR
jgi:hypothetical protein